MIFKNDYESNWRASLVPAAAVIPAPGAYSKVVAVKALVVGGVCVCVYVCIYYIYRYMYM